jgi:hypothetical protein
LPSRISKTVAGVTSPLPSCRGPLGATTSGEQRADQRHDDRDRAGYRKWRLLSSGLNQNLASSTTAGARASSRWLSHVATTPLHTHPRSRGVRLRPSVATCTSGRGLPPSTGSKSCGMTTNPFSSSRDHLLCDFVDPAPVSRRRTACRKT